MLFPLRLLLIYAVVIIILWQRAVFENRSRRLGLK